MTRKIITFFLMVLVFIPVLEAITPASYTSYAHPATGTYPTTPATFTVIATGASDVRPETYKGMPPIGFTNASGVYIAVENLAGKKLPVDAVVTISTITAQLAVGVNTIGSIGAIVSPLPAGANTLGTVSVILPSTPAGVNTIGSIGAIVSPLPTGTNTIGTVSTILHPLLEPTTGNLAAITPGTSVSIPADGYHLSLAMKTLGVTAWYRVGTATVSVEGNGHEPLSYASDFDVQPSSVVGIISSVTASVTYRIDRR